MRIVSSAASRASVVFVGVLLARGAWAQSDRHTEVDWVEMDRIFVGAFDWAAVAAFALAFLFASLFLGLLVVPFSARSWLFTRPMMRIFPTAFLAFALVCFPYVAGPLYWSRFGIWPYEGVADWYFSSAAFTKVNEYFPGMLFGLLGSERPAIAQIHYLLLVPLLGCALGAGLAALLSRFLARRQWGKRGVRA